jgi:hypothetical protein
MNPVFEEMPGNPMEHEMHLPEASCPRRSYKSIRKGLQIQNSSFEIAANNLES